MVTDKIHVHTKHLYTRDQTNKQAQTAPARARIITRAHTAPIRPRPDK